jgi:hypothetical protein
MIKSFLVRVNGTGNNSDGRLFRITPLESFPVSDDDYVPVDCKDIRTRFESQSIVELSTAASRETLLADSQTQDAIASAYLNATSYESGRYPAGGVLLPEGFTVTPI